MTRSKTRSNLKVQWEWESVDGQYISFDDGNLIAGWELSGEIDLTYASALNLASKLLQWATNLPESEKGNVHKIDGEWVDIDGHSED